MSVEWRVGAQSVRGRHGSNVVEKQSDGEVGSAVALRSGNGVAVVGPRTADGHNAVVGGDTWSLSATCVWRWVDHEGRIVMADSGGATDTVWDLVGDELVAATWMGPKVLGVDPRFLLRSGGTLDLLSDAAFDTWVLHLPEITLVGLLREE